MNESLVKKIRQLPPLPKTIEEFERAYNDPDISLEDIAKILEHDPMLVANILKTVNSPYYGLRNEITTVSHAISLLGLSQIKGIVLQNTIKKLLNIDMEPYGITAEEFANISHLQSNLMYRWYRKIDSRKLNTLVMAALLQEMGKILIADEIIQEDMLYPFHSEIEAGADITLVEKSFVGVTAAEVTGQMFEYWGFDPLFVNSIRYSDDYLSAPEDVKDYSLALHIVKTAAPVNSPLSEVSINKALALSEKEGLGTEFLEDAAMSLRNSF
ncbi:HDOD domain-containing protein [Nitrosophilus alvini]|uniref:HDOD domain-containing protein n=1 Tax=Nitrosophilus alvini TaxID=2714855 RepID=UPI00190A1F33|nr:HDOD domain-containing protein [Nitrosophilus alvini]